MFAIPKPPRRSSTENFYASIRLDVRRIDSIKVDNVVSAVDPVKVVKNKVARRFGRRNLILSSAKVFPAKVAW
jgi:RecA/RadA recombinase